jgi:O-antigen ligase
MAKLAKTIEYLFYLFIFLLPWQTRWIWDYGKLGGEFSQYLTFCLYGTEILLLMLLFLGLIYKFRKTEVESILLNYKALDFYILFMLFVIICAFTYFWAGNKDVVLYFIIKILEGFALFMFIINFRFNLNNFGLAFLLGGIGQAMLAIHQFLSQKVFACKWLGLAEQLPQTLGSAVIEFGNQRILRAYGAFSHPNILGGYLAITLIILLVLILLAETKKQRIFYWLCLPIILSGLFFTFSKSAFLALAIAFIFLIIFILLSKEKKNILTKFILIIFVTLAILSLFYKDLVFTRLKGEQRLENKSSQERILYWEQAKSLLKENWLQGVGLGNYTLAVYNHLPEKQAAWFYQPVHNVYLLIFTETGLAGFFIFLLIILEGLRKLYHFQIDKSINLLGLFKKFNFAGIHTFYQEHFYWFLGLTAIWLLVLVIMAFDHYFWTQYFGIILWWLCLGMFVKTMGGVK